LAAISSLSPFGVVIMVPLIPLLSVTFDRSIGDLQYLISIYVMGLAISQPLVGMLADRTGKRPVLLAGFTLFVVSSVALMLANTLQQMVALRFLQAVGVGAGTVIARSMIRDHLAPAEALKAFALLTAAMGFTPVIAPILGGLFAAKGGTTSVFALLATLGLLLLLWCLRSIPKEPAEVRQEQRVTLRGYRSLLASGLFWGHACAFGFIQGMFFTLLSTGGALFNQQFDMSITAFGTVWGVLSLTYVVGSFLISHSAKLGTPTWQRRAVMAMLVVSLSAPALLFISGLTLVAILAPVACSMLLSGVLTPATLYGSVNAIPKYSGSAAGLSSAVGMSMAALFSYQGALA
jgi:DHA1 family bicyclomycin/chloramphenicol resistance-like MFS transporter